MSTAALALAEVLFILLLAVALAWHELSVLRDEERRDAEARRARGAERTSGSDGDASGPPPGS
jgi:hypothetical protein